MSTTIWNSKTDLGPTENTELIVTLTIRGGIKKVVGIMAPIIFGICFDQEGRIAEVDQNPLFINRVFKHESNSM